MFLIDAQLPPVIKEVFAEFKISSVHILEILKGDETPDQAIADYADLENLIVVTKDSDFCFSHTLKKSPKKLLLITTGDIKE
jgi:predicted nuclease of predicted toxin-antitoxin system